MGQYAGLPEDERTKEEREGVFRPEFGRKAEERGEGRGVVEPAGIGGGDSGTIDDTGGDTGVRGAGGATGGANGGARRMAGSAGPTTAGDGAGGSAAGAAAGTGAALWLLYLQHQQQQFRQQAAELRQLLQQQQRLAHEARLIEALTHQRGGQEGVGVIFNISLTWRHDLHPLGARGPGA